MKTTRRCFLGGTACAAAVAGFYGDVGYALFRAFPDRAELTLRQDDFFFNRDWVAKGKSRPKNWAARVAAHRDSKVTFFYEKPGNFYRG